jgi:hypothetical protein
MSGLLCFHSLDHDEQAQVGQDKVLNDMNEMEDNGYSDGGLAS